MTRQEQIEFLGKHQPSKFKEDKRNFLSYFIIPLPHKVYDFKTIDEFLNKVDKNKWKILNEKEGKRVLDYNKELKKHVYETFLPFYNEEEKNNFFIEKKHFLLRKEINKEFEIETKYNNGETKCNKFVLEDIDLWILEENIAFFVLKFGINKNSKLTINDLSALNRIRDFRNFKIDKNANVIDYLLGLTKVGNKSFLNITKKDLESDEFYPIYNSSYYAKLLTAVHIDIDDNKLSEIKGTTTKELKKVDIDKIDIIEEIPFLLASTSEFYPVKTWEANEEYINEMVNRGGINIWKYWSGTALKDSLAFFSVNDGKGMIVSSCKDINYFIYILNLYLNYSVKLLENRLARDKYFFDIEKSFKMAERLQVLKNLYMSEEIAIKFQPNKIHQAILSGLETKELLEEVQNNVEKTYDRTKDNTEFIATLFTITVALVGLFVSQDDIREFIHKNIILALSLFLIFGLIIISSRRKIIGGISRLKIILPHIANKIKMFWKIKATS
jgi:hypothetical protein